MRPFAYLRHFIAWDSLASFDAAIYDFIYGFFSETLTRVMKLFTFLGSEWTIVVLTIAIPIFIFIFKIKKYYIFSLVYAANIALGSPIYYILKQLYQRVRPDLNRLIDISGYSFPSGHSMNSMIFYGFLVIHCLKLIKHPTKNIFALGLGALIFFIGVSRIYLGVHYASDVLAGFLLGFGWLALYTRITNRYIYSSEIIKHK